MRSLMSIRLVIGLGLGLLWATAPAARADPEKVKFMSVDGVELRGLFYPSDKGKKAPTVLMIHRIGGKSQEDGWDSLAVELSKKGFAVLTFDLRGHGDSTNLRDPKLFWSQPINQQLAKSFNPTKLKETISIKDFGHAYEPYLANDVAAAKEFLDIKKNDAGECNTANLILIGEENGAGLGLLWLATEWYRYKMIPAQPGIGFQPTIAKDPEARDVVFAIWLSANTTLGGQAAPVHDWIRFTGKDHKLPMTFVHGDGDATGTNFAKHALNELKPPKTDKFTADRSVKETKLVGTKLLNKNLDTEKDIVGYCGDFIEDKGITDWGARDTKKSFYVWVPPALRPIPITAKNSDDDTLNWLPFNQLGIRLAGP